jgi:hypothetical protein
MDDTTCGRSMEILLGKRLFRCFVDSVAVLLPSGLLPMASCMFKPNFREI